LKPAPTKNENVALNHARHALLLMTERGIEPTPVNYAIWYHYTSGDKKELKREMDELLGQKAVRITNDVHVYLYNKHINTRPDKEEQAAEVTALNTQSVLSEIMKVMEKFTGETATYNQQIDQQISGLSEKITDPALKVMAKEIIDRTMAIRNSGMELSQRLEESKREVTELKTNLNKVTTESNRDFLTGTANRKAFEAKIDELTAWAKERQKDLCLLMIDIDHFKQFNDKYGHLIGDEILRKVGHALFEGVKGKDFVARYGGEEFAILLPDTGLAGGLAVAEHLRRNIAETDLVRKDTGTSLGVVTVSVGVARYRTDADSSVLLISRADNALYRSKMGGRNRVTQESFDAPQ